MKKRSFIRNLSIMLFMQFVLLTVLFVALIVHMRNSAVTEMETAADNVLAIYRVNLENRIERANNILKNLTLSEETALEMIRSDKESDRYYAKKSIYTAMHAALLQDNAVDLLIVAENSYGGYMESTNGDSSKWALPYETRKKLAGYGAAIIRLDAFAYAPKAPGSHNFMNEPETWNTLERVRELAAPYGLTLLPEIHASYEEKTYEKVANYGYLTYDFFLPGLLIDAIEQKDGTALAGWANELIEKHIVTVNMLGCHDGIPLLDLRGLLPEERIAGLIDLIIARGGFVKNLHGQKNVYYQVNATYYSALGEDDRKMLVARAIQLFMPGKPQVWYLDLFAGKNDHEAVAKAGEGGHKEINRTNLTIEQIHSALTQDVVKKQIELLRFRKSSRAFTSNAKISVISNKNNMHFIWQGNTTAELSVDFTTMSYEVKENGYIMMKG